MSYARTKVWVWFKGGLDGGEWRGGFYATDNAEHEEAVTLQHGDFKDCVVPPWRISTMDRTDLQKGPAHAGQSQVILQSCAGLIKSSAPIH